MAKREIRPTTRPTTDPDPSPSETRAALDRIAIPLNPDGTPALDRMRDSTRDTLRKIVSNPETARALGLGADDSPVMIPLDLARAALTSFNQLAMLGVAAITKAPAPLLREHMTYHAAELDRLAPLAQRVISKHAGPSITKWSDEIALGAMLLTDLQTRIALIRAAMNVEPRETARIIPIMPVPSSMPDAPRAATADDPRGNDDSDPLA